LARIRPGLLFPVLAVASLLAGLFALISGSADISAGEVWQLISGNAEDNARNVIMELRLPRALTAFGVGGLLAVAGVLMQVLLRNPLAEPYILGSSGGAAVAALLAMMFGLGATLIDVSAFAGAMLATLLVFSIAQGTGNWTPTRLLLTGVVLAAGFSAATTLLLALSPDQNLRGMLFWLVGDLSFSYSPAQSLWLLAAITVAGLVSARDLNVLARGDLQAAIVGLPVAGFRMIIFAVTALATAISVTTVGVIGFIGLVVPHLIRIVAGSDHRIVLPASALAGGILLVLADTLSRTVLAPRQLPVGALTAAIGVPLFLILMSRSRRTGPAAAFIRIRRLPPARAYSPVPSPPGRAPKTWRCTGRRRHEPATTRRPSSDLQRRGRVRYSQCRWMP
jgi:iron complex transport system permease protein